MPTYVILKVGVMVGAASSRDFFQCGWCKSRLEAAPTINQLLFPKTVK
jgi:hypothetical protein